MSRFDTIFYTFVSGYWLIAVVTYGHAWTTTLTSGETRLFGSAISAFFWPLYWSVEFWK